VTRTDISSKPEVAVLRHGPRQFPVIVKLVLNHNGLGDRVRAGALDGQGTSLGELQLAGCGITSLPARLLAGMDALVTLHLWGNRLRQFPVRFFRDAANLRELMLWSNELAELDSDTLAGL